jgi:hypothetical protein
MKKNIKKKRSEPNWVNMPNLRPGCDTRKTPSKAS